jgi:integrase/recombinase XerC
MCGDLVEQHLDHLRLLGRAESTIYARRRALARTAAGLQVPLTEATAADLMAWRRGLRVAPETIAQYVSHVQEFFAFLLSAGRVAINPAAGIPVPEIGRRLPRPISEPDLMRAMADPPPRIRPWLVLAGWTGLRAKEIALLRREHVLDGVRPPVLLVAAGATKGRRERIVPISAFVIRELPITSRSGYLFRRGDGGGGPNTPQIVSQLAAAYLHDLGLADTLHHLRHRFGTMLYRQTRDLRLVQELLGHANPATTAGYAAYDQVSAVAAVAALPVPSVYPMVMIR